MVYRISILSMIVNQNESPAAHFGLRSYVPVFDCVGHLLASWQVLFVHETAVKNYNTFHKL